MKKGHFQKDSPKHIPVIIWILIAIIAVLLSMVLILLSRNVGFTLFSDSSFDNDTVLETTVEQNPDSIAIPGYEMLQFTADTKKQTLSLPNPAQNMCYFQISLYLEDSTLLWESELIKPGKTSKPIVLEKELEKGTYPNAILRYSCFRMDDDLSPLNGAEMKLTLWVS